MRDQNHAKCRGRICRTGKCTSNYFCLNKNCQRKSQIRYVQSAAGGDSRLVESRYFIRCVMPNIFCIMQWLNPLNNIIIMHLQSTIVPQLQRRRLLMLQNTTFKQERCNSSLCLCICNINYMQHCRFRDPKMNDNNEMCTNRQFSFGLRN